MTKKSREMPLAQPWLKTAPAPSKVSMHTYQPPGVVPVAVTHGCGACKLSRTCLFFSDRDPESPLRVWAYHLEAFRQPASVANLQLERTGKGWAALPRSTVRAPGHLGLARENGKNLSKDADDSPKSAFIRRRRGEGRQAGDGTPTT